MNQIEDIKTFLHAENSLLQKAKRYDADINYLLNQLMSESHRHARCEEDMRSTNPANIAKLRQMDLAANIIQVIDLYYSPFATHENLLEFEKYRNALAYDNVDKLDIDAFANILKLVVDYYSAPAAC